MSFATAINCMDGRVQLPVIEWMKQEFSVEYVDMITEAGPNKVILESPEETLASIKAKVAVSYEKHGSQYLAIVGHHDCAGNPVDKSVKVDQIKQAIEVIRSFGYDMTIIGLYVNENWQVERLL